MRNSSVQQLYLRRISETEQSRYEGAIALRIQMMGVFVEIALLPSSDRHRIALTCSAFLEPNDHTLKR
ncbi:hypothetical protein K9N68_24720 [Kovacikia minuta CCNUW1]|uniref:hypothetical protein n=1 Tax=Kovacikia minuta TaxID=2931930 RepID=UPI001CCA2078|nr:hypothetical protein [Kovacikia minuta]UBF24833.1 hypothetical protein K9N68_24720 [Kovacikia minuta CCNUW1]